MIDDMECSYLELLGEICPRSTKDEESNRGCATGSTKTQTLIQVLGGKTKLGLGTNFFLKMVSIDKYLKICDRGHGMLIS